MGPGELFHHGFMNIKLLFTVQAGMTEQEPGAEEVEGVGCTNGSLLAIKNVDAFLTSFSMGMNPVCHLLSMIPYGRVSASVDTRASKGCGSVPMA